MNGRRSRVGLAGTDSSVEAYLPATSSSEFKDVRGIGVRISWVLAKHCKSFGGLAIAPPVLRVGPREA